MPQDLETVQHKLAYQFKDQNLLKLALTHRSASASNNERLEFLGDALLDLIVGESLFRIHADAKEGDLSRMRSSIVNKQALAAVSRSLEIGDHVQLGSGELKSGGQSRDSILADALEAIVAAIYLDGGMTPCKEFVESWALELVHNPAQQREKDAKTQLQELMQASGQPLPKYRVVHTEGDAHEQTFLVECAVDGLDQPMQGLGRSKRGAEQQAAQKALQRLSVNQRPGSE